MISADECKTRLIDCQTLGTSADISIERATAVMAVCRAWVVLGGAVARYEAVVLKERSAVS
jgi:uncharacterized protein related to proFAR isomerase